MDRLGFLELSHIVRSLGADSEDVGEFRETLRTFHEFMAHAHHPDVATVVLETGRDLIRKTIRSAVASVARRLSRKLLPGMRLKVRHDSDLVSFTVTFPDFRKLGDEDFDLYHRRIFLEVFDTMRSLSEDPPLISVRLWDGDLYDSLPSGSCPCDDAEGTLHFRGDGATYKTSIERWRHSVPTYLDGVTRIQTRINKNAISMGGRVPHRM
jgi:hypothetical protein